MRGENNPAFKGWRSRNKRAYVNRFRAKYPERAVAHDAVKHAVQNGLLIKPTICERCFLTPATPLHGHHEDYSKPLDVQWVCRPCHRLLDLQRWQREHPEWINGRKLTPMAFPRSA